MRTVPERTWPDEAPTRKTEPVTLRMHALAARIDRLAELAQERLRCAPDADGLLAAAADLAQIRELAEGVLR